MTARDLLTASLALGLALPARGEVNRYVRFEYEGGSAYGILEQDSVRELEGDLFDSPRPTGRSLPLSQVKLLAPVVPSKVIAVGLNYKSHLGGREAPAEPPLFAKFPTSIIGPGDSIVLPPGAENVHFESELVLVIGKRAKNVSPERAGEHILGVTCGNDVSARDWQRNDLQWFRAKGSDTFGPLGPAIAVGLDYGDLLLQGRLNSEVVQSQRTSDLLFGPAEIVAFASRYVTLEPGDVIFTGTPGSTRALKPGDVFEVEIEGVGVLRNPVAASPGER